MKRTTVKSMYPLQVELLKKMLEFYTEEVDQSHSRRDREWRE